MMGDMQTSTKTGKPRGEAPKDMERAALAPSMGPGMVGKKQVQATPRRPMCVALGPHFFGEQAMIEMKREEVKKR
jgi:hypothetical protein